MLLQMQMQMQVQTNLAVMELSTAEVHDTLYNRWFDPNSMLLPSRNALIDIPGSSSNLPISTGPANLGRCWHFAIDRVKRRLSFFSRA